MHFKSTVTGFLSWPGMFQVCFDVLDIGGDGLGLVDLAACSADDEPNVDILH